MKDKSQEKKRTLNSKTQIAYAHRYPKEICRFDDDFAPENLAVVRDTKILKKLKQTCEEAKILWKATDQTGKHDLDGVFDQGNFVGPVVPTQHKQFLIYLHLAISYAKLLASDGRLNRHRALSLERAAIYSFYVDSFNKAKFCLERWRAEYDTKFSHPFAQLIFRYLPDAALEQIQSSTYKRDEASFRRTGNADRKVILDTLTEQLELNKNIVIHRLRLYTHAFVDPHSRESSQFKSDLNIVFERINHLSKNNLICAVNSIFPSALCRAGLQGFEGTIGHLVLIFKKNEFTQNTNLLDSLNNYASLINGLTFGFFVVEKTQNSSKGKTGRSTPLLRARPALEQVAEYMTIERRYIRPGFRVLSAPNSVPSLKQQHTLFVKKFK